MKTLDLFTEYIDTLIKTEIDNVNNGFASDPALIREITDAVQTISMEVE